MRIDTVSDLVGIVRDLDLVGAARHDELGRLADQFATPRDLARHLMQRDWISAFQANQLLQGKGRLLHLGPYILLERIASGGMGVVFKARHRRLHRLCAVKVINNQRLQHPSAIERFLREAEAAAQFSHPNIVAVHDADVHGDTYYLAMEFIDGIDLGRLLTRLGPMPYSLASELIAQACVGLHHAHEMGYVHRDIKPGNLLVAPRGGVSRMTRAFSVDRFRGATVKLLDLGLVRLQPHRLEDTDMALTHHGVVIGTMDYLPPEQARNSHRVDRRADLYSLGCTFFQLLTGKPPFAGATPIDKLLRHQTEEPPPLGDIRPDVPEELEEIIQRLLAKHPDDRFDTAAELVMLLLPFANQTPTPVLVCSEVASGRVSTGAELEATQQEEPPPVEPATESLRLAGPGAEADRRTNPEPEAQGRLWWFVGGAAAMVLLGVALLRVL